MHPINDVESVYTQNGVFLLFSAKLMEGISYFVLQEQTQNIHCTMHMFFVEQVNTRIYRKLIELYPHGITGTF